MIRDRRTNDQINYQRVRGKPDTSLTGNLFTMQIDNTKAPSLVGPLFRTFDVAFDRSQYKGPGISADGSTFNQTVVPDNNPLNIRENLPGIVVSGPLLPGFVCESSFPPDSSDRPLETESSSSSSSNTPSSSSSSQTASFSSSSSSNTPTSSTSSSRTLSSSSSGIFSSSSSTSDSTSSSTTSSDTSLSSASDSSTSTSSNEIFSSSSSNTPSSSSSSSNTPSSTSESSVSISSSSTTPTSLTSNSSVSSVSDSSSSSVEEIDVTFDPTNEGDSVTLLEGNTRAVVDTTLGSAISTTYKTNSGKWYAEFEVILANTFSQIGFVEGSQVVGTLNAGVDTYGIAYESSGDVRESGSGAPFGDSWTSGDVVSLLLNLNNNTMEALVNGSSQGSFRTSIDDTENWYLGVSQLGIGGTDTDIRLRTKSSEFTYAPPAGFYSWASGNDLVLNQSESSSSESGSDSSTSGSESSTSSSSNTPSSSSSSSA